MTRSAVSPRTRRGLLLVDDHTIVREGLKRILEPIAGDWAVTEAGTGFQALEFLRNQPFDLAIVDLSMPGMSGLELIRRIKAAKPPTAVLVLSMHAEEQYALRAFKAGANGYVTKDSAAAELIAAVHKVAAGGAYVSASLAERVVQQLSGGVQAPRHTELSDRELEVLQRIVAGERLTDIAQALHLSIKTVSTHKSRILDKLQLTSTAALIRYGFEHQLAKDDSGYGLLEAEPPPVRSKPARRPT
ncbi:MAG: response regulator transcription factor [Burkholderiales bacterium]|nr:response regulator transcription factor [Burkholderiales bacterium]MDE2628139.1 response regulator transcription factor [Burkholderiales bacterium]